MPGTTQAITQEEVNLLFTQACCAQSEGRLTEARDRYLLLLRYLPNATPVHYNIGLVYFALGSFTEALDEFSLALTLGPEDTDVLFNLALCQSQMGDRLAAIVSYQRILEITPDSVDCLYNLAGCYRDSHEYERAALGYLRVLEVNPEYLPAINNLAYLCHRQGDTDQALIWYRRVLTLRPEDDAARFMLASLVGTSAIAQAPESYIRGFFDAYAEDFEFSLVTELGYDNPRKLYEFLGRCPGHKTVYEHGLDLGCGTGLSGTAFIKAVMVLDGVDLSANMLAQAAQKGCYSQLYLDTIRHYLRTTSETYDFFLATDVLIYIGDLYDLFKDTAAIARPQALFCFSTEHMETGSYQLRPTGRFAYSRAYVQEVAATTGWVLLALENSDLRKEREVWIAGDLWVLRRDSCSVSIE
ncbi:tetratricopeptide repeat protein [Desulfobulbus alkaliphilus]|uniref:tetratricopeptide repeat protein n=1 Tax=Desulfobulbus alkaliphilus TaxID=869814 RepID=UPI0019658E3E|nr:tetratricopeptide repeat protein [Desulfobulbus alkaliphilus]MBM9536489.1 tetratricopeptide repeat protein [Desulfobulbus alkaliphilus]